MYTQSTDQLGTIHHIPFPPARIVSLVPSQTEFLFDINLDNEIAGITRFCVHPGNKVPGKAKIGGTKKFNFEKIRSLRPDLIIGNKEENYEEGILALAKHFPVWMSDIYTMQDAYAMMHELGRITNKQAEADAVINQIINGFSSVQKIITEHPPGRSCAYFIWRKPYMVAAGNTFINHMLQVFGFSNVLANMQRYPQIDPWLLESLNPRYIFLSSEPYSFSEKHFAEFQSYAPKAKIILVDGEIFSWYGSRLKHAPAYYHQLSKFL